MATTALKTRANARSVSAFLARIKDRKVRDDCSTILRMMKSATGAKPTMWGSAIVGFGTFHYESRSGRSGDWFLTGFSPRKQYIALYLMSGFKQHADLMKKLGTYKTSAGCLYLKSLDDVRLRPLQSLIRRSVKHMRTLHKEANV
jgi:hypothetical protein